MPVPSLGCVRGRVAQTAARGMAGGGMPVAHLTGRGWRLRPDLCSPRSYRSLPGVMKVMSSASTWGLSLSILHVPSSSQVLSLAS